MHPLRLLTAALLLAAASASAQSVPDPATATRRADSALDDLRGSVHNRVTFEGQAEDFERLLADYQSALGKQQVDDYRAALANARAEYQQFAAAEDSERLRAEVDDLEISWRNYQSEQASMSPNSREGAIDDLRRSIERLRAERARLPGSESLGARIEAVAVAFESAIGGAEAAAQLASLREYWQRDASETEGWEAERAIDLSTYASTRSRESNAFGLPKTLERFELATHKLAQARERGEPAAWIAELEAERNATRAKLMPAVQALVTAAGNRPGSDEAARESMTRLAEQLRVSLGAESDPAFGTLARQADEWLAAAAAEDTSSEEGRARWYQQMKVSAAAAWPQMESQFEFARGFDPANPAAMEGQLIRIETDNLMGWRFKVGDFPFATTINGLPVAGTYDAQVAAAIAEVEGKLGRALGDSDDDGRWTVIAEITGQMGRMQLRKQVEGDIRDASSGEKLGTYRGEEAEAVDAPIIRIVAAHIGPLAAAAGVGRAAADGSLERVAGALPTPRTAAAGGALFSRFTGLMLLLAGALVAYVQARPDAVRALAEARAQGARVRSLAAHPAVVRAGPRGGGPALAGRRRDHGRLAPGAGADRLRFLRRPARAAVARPGASRRSPRACSLWA
jgi:hypothetical protein